MADRVSSPSDLEELLSVKASLPDVVATVGRLKVYKELAWLAAPMTYWSMKSGEGAVGQVEGGLTVGKHSIHVIFLEA